MLSSWNDYLLMVRRGHSRMDDEFLKGFSTGIQKRIESYEPERVGRLADTIGMVTNPVLKKITLETIFKEDLETVFPSSDLSMDILTEAVFHKSKKKARNSTEEKKTTKPKSQAVIETGLADTVNSEGTDSEGTNLQPVSKKEDSFEQDDSFEKEDSSKREDTVENVKVDTQESVSQVPPISPVADKPLPVAKDEGAEQEETKGKKEDDAASLVDLQVDPINGVAARLLKVNDFVIVSRSSGFKAAAKVTSVAKDPTELDYLKVTMCLDNNVTGQSVIFKNALVAVEKEEIASEGESIYKEIIVYSTTFGTVVMLLCYLTAKILLTGGL